MRGRRRRWNARPASDATSRTAATRASVRRGAGVDAGRRPHRAHPRATNGRCAAAVPIDEKAMSRRETVAGKDQCAENGENRRAVAVVGSNGLLRDPKKNNEKKTLRYHDKKTNSWRKRRMTWVARNDFRRSETGTKAHAATPPSLTHARHSFTSACPPSPVPCPSVPPPRRAALGSRPPRPWAPASPRSRPRVPPSPAEAP